MLHIFCPHCGELRSEEEFHSSGQAHIPRPLDPNTCTDEQWGDYMFFRDNPRGLHHELWIHAAGCRQYFNATRDTVTYEILETYKMFAYDAGWVRRINLAIDSGLTAESRSTNSR